MDCFLGGARGAHQGADGVDDRHARVDVGDQLTITLRRVRPIAQQHDLGLLRGASGAGIEKRARQTDIQRTNPRSSFTHRSLEKRLLRLEHRASI